jgi:CRISPR/Cas system CSM-associated protein Csm5 (group 7 of RAMP superfamily)
LASGLGRTETSVNNTATGRPKQFLVDLAQAMRVTAEAERRATIDQCQANAKAYVEGLQSQTSGESATLQQAAVADISTLRSRSKARMDKTRQETEQRISQRYVLLEQDLQEYTAAIEGEIERVQDRVQAFEAELAQSFEQLMETSDPSEFTYLAEHMPEPLPFEEPDSAALVQEYRRGQAVPSEAQAGPSPEE